MSEEKLSKELEAYRELANQDKKIDVATLMINALQKQQTNTLTIKEKRWAYLISIGVPPFGLIFAVKFYFSGKDDGEQAAWVCVVLTAVSILIYILFAKILFSGSAATIGQIEQIKPSDIQ